MAQVISATEVLNCEAADAWECCKHSDKVLPDLLPEYFSKAEVLEGSGGPGTLRVLHFGPGMHTSMPIHKWRHGSTLLPVLGTSSEMSPEEIFSSLEHVYAGDMLEYYVSRGYIRKWRERSPVVDGLGRIFQFFALYGCC